MMMNDLRSPIGKWSFKLGDPSNTFNGRQFSYQWGEVIDTRLSEVLFLRVVVFFGEMAGEIGNLVERDGVDFDGVGAV